MIFARRLRVAVMRGEITCSIRIWQSPRVRVGGRYRLGAGAIHVTSVREIPLEDVTDDLARISGFESVEDLMSVARHGRGTNVYLVRFVYEADQPAPG